MARPEAWVELAARAGGEVEARGRKVKAVRFPHGRWTITLDTQSDGESTTTRMFARFAERAPLRMSIRRHDAFTRIASAFGMRYVSVPNPDIDGAFLVRTDNASVVRSLVLDRNFSRPLQAVRKGRIEVVPIRKGLRRLPGVAELRWTATGTIKDIDVLGHALALVRASIDGLTRLGIARAPLDSA